MTLSRRPIVFVVDDEGVIVRTLTIILQQSGFDAVAFTGPGDALAYARHPCPDLVISKRSEIVRL